MNNVPIPPGTGATTLPQEPKVKSNGYLGFIHFLIGGLIIPIIAGIILNAIVQGVLKNSPSVIYVESILGLLVLWFATSYSAKRLTKKYVVRNPQKVAIIATAYYVILFGLIIFVLGTVIAQVGQSGALLSQSMLLNGALTIIEFFLFYWVSKTYLSKKPN